MHLLASIDLIGTLGESAVGDISDFILYEYSLEALRLIHSLGLEIVIITNHSRIAQGYLTFDEFNMKRDHLTSRFERAGAPIADFLFCPHAKDAGCACRKPRTGLIDAYRARRTAFDLPRSYVIGDMLESDLILARNLGSRGILVETGAGVKSLALLQGDPVACQPYSIQDNMLEAARFIERDLGSTSSSLGEAADA